MSTEPKKLLAPMTDRPVTLDAPEFQVDRARMLAAMAHAAQQHEPVRPRFAGYAVLAVAAAVLMGIGVHVWRGRAVENTSLEIALISGSATQSNGSEQITLASAVTRIPATGDLSTQAGSAASVRTEKGIKLELSADTRVALRELTPAVNRVTLAQGSIHCSVPHDPSGQPFQVVTSVATIVDVGTVFSVSMLTPSSILVSVDEGEVSIRTASGEKRLHAPNQWSSAGTTADDVPDVTTTPPPASVPTAGHKSGHISAKPTQSSVAPEPTLGLESQLLRRGLSAERQGNAAEAAAAFNQLLTQYPSSPLAPDARAALARVQAANHE